METLLFLNLNIGMILGLVTGSIIILPLIFLVLCYRVFAPKDIFFTFSRENRIMHIMIGKKFSGKVILPSKTLYVDKNYDIKSFDKFPSNIKQRNIFGMYWIGFWPFYSIYERHQQWLEWRSTKTGREIQFRDEMTPYLIAKPFEYAMMLKEGEDKKGVPLNVSFTIILMPTNAVRPIFGNDNAYEQVQTLCLGEALLFVKERTFSNLGGENTASESKEEITDEFSAAICKINRKIPGRPDGLGLVEVLGYEIMDAKLDSVDIAGDQKAKLLEASTVEYVAKEKAKAKVAEAEGDLQATRLSAEGKKAVLNVQKDYLKDISSIPGAMKVEERKATPLLTTLVEADSDKKTSLLIGGK